MRIAFVVQRYGREVLGGAEGLCLQVAERLAGRFEIEVLTTCARDYLTWADAYPPGEERLGGVTVRRFPVARPRRVRAFGRLSQRIFDRPHDFRDEAEWMQRQGPDSPALLAAIAAARGRCDLFVFFTYLYAPTYFGLPLVAERALLAPMAHDEPPLRLGLFRALFHLPRGFIFNTGEERDFVHARFRNAHLPWTVAGAGIDLPPEPAGAAAAAAPPGRDYLLYLGRVDVEKGCGELVEEVRGANGRGGPPVRLVLAGEEKMKLPRDPAVEPAGRVSEARKRELLAGALALVVPSRYESLSLAALEAWAEGTPVVARADSPVLAGHLARSGGGWSYAPGGLGGIVDALRADPPERRRRGLAGRAYVAERYGWERAVGAYGAFLERMGALVAGDGGAGRD